MSNVLVRIPQGELQGLEEESSLGSKYFSFQKIPYAKPPVGDSRFKSPQPAEGWTGVRDATKPGPVCPVLDSVTGQYSELSDEDSLFANVYTKELPENLGDVKKPVLFWIHGGGFTSGTGNRDMYGPDFIMVQDIVLVTINYRLAALGFLSLKTPECPGNYGLKDIRLALQWAKENVAYFGGDPENVTIFGESAGSAAVHYLLLSPSTKGLFKRAIAQSGTAVSSWAYGSHPREVAFILGKRLGLDTTDDSVLFDFLKKVSPKDIVENSEKILHEIQGINAAEDVLSYAFVPTAEPESPDAFFTQHPWTLIKEGKQQDVPLMLGSCTRELAFLQLLNVTIPELTEDEEFQIYVPRDLGLDKDSDLSLEIAKRIRQFYFKDGDLGDNFFRATSAAFFLYGISRTVKERVTNQNFKAPTYLYSFSYLGGRNMLPNETETVHGQDLFYQFNPCIMPMPPLEQGSKDHKFILAFTKLWADFAATGVPTSETSNAIWLPATAEVNNYFDIGEEQVLREGFHKEEIQFWDEIYALVNI